MIITFQSTTLPSLWQNMYFMISQRYRKIHKTPAHRWRTCMWIGTPASPILQKVMFLDLIHCTYNRYTKQYGFWTEESYCSRLILNIKHIAEGGCGQQTQPRRHQVLWTRLCKYFYCCSLLLSTCKSQFSFSQWLSAEVRTAKTELLL